MHYHVLFLTMRLHLTCSLTYYIVTQDGDESSPILTSFEIVKVPDPQMSMVSYCQISYESAFLHSDYDLDPKKNFYLKKKQQQQCN